MLYGYIPWQTHSQFASSVKEEGSGETCHLRVEWKLQMRYENTWEGGKGTGFFVSRHQVLSETILLCQVGTAVYPKVQGKQTNEGTVSHQPNAIYSQVHAESAIFLNSMWYQMGEEVTVSK